MGVSWYGVDVTVCVGPSMLPTFNATGDVVLLNRFCTLLGTLKRGDVVIADSPSKPGQKVCKRIVAVEGDVVHVPTWHGTRQPFSVPRGHVWLEGDNAANSTDSRHYGPVPLDSMQGRVFCRFWPPSEAGAVVNAFPDRSKGDRWTIQSKEEAAEDRRERRRVADEHLKRAAAGLPPPAPGLHEAKAAAPTAAATTTLEAERPPPPPRETHNLVLDRGPLATVVPAQRSRAPVAPAVVAQADEASPKPPMNPTAPRADAALEAGR